MIKFESKLTLYAKGLTNDHTKDDRIWERYDQLIKQAKELGITLRLIHKSVEHHRLGDHVFYRMVLEGDKLTVRYFLKYVVKHFRCTDDWNSTVCNSDPEDRYYISED